MLYFLKPLLKLKDLVGHVLAISRYLFVNHLSILMVNSDFYIADLHKENIVRFVDPSGHAFFFVIDCMAYFNTPGLGLGGSFLILDPEVWAYKSENEWPYAIRSNDKPLHYL